MLSRYFITSIFFHIALISQMIFCHIAILIHDVILHSNFNSRCFVTPHFKNRIFVHRYIIPGPFFTALCLGTRI
jgi:hypothetical protein